MNSLHLWWVSPLEWRLLIIYKALRLCTDFLVNFVLLIEKILTLFVEFAVDLILVRNESLDIFSELIQIVFNDFVFFGYLGLDDVEYFVDLVVFEGWGLLAGSKDDDFVAF